MPDEFPYDVFLSHSAKDKALVRPFAERLRADGLKVWFDEWELKPGDSIPAKIEEGLEHSRVLVLCMSANAFGSDWAQLESATFRFRDPLNKERRFIPLRLDDAPIRGSLAQFLYVNWLPEHREQEYAKLLEVCRPQTEPAAADLSDETFGQPDAQASSGKVAGKAIQLEYTAAIWAYAFSPDGKRALTGADDKTVRLWDLETGRCLRVFKGHTGDVRSIVWSTDQRHALSGGDGADPMDYPTVRLWDVDMERCLQVLTCTRL